MAGTNISPVDTLLTGVKKFKSGAETKLYDLVGKDLYDIFYKKEIERNMPFGIRSKYDFKDRSLSLRKQDVFKGWDARLDAKKDNLKFKLSKEF
tara:strand:- start:152 stop:433 length:282 start_codon:yes stop_codon:yes gene_type:complete